MNRDKINHFTFTIMLVSLALFLGCSTSSLQVKKAGLSDNASYFWLGSKAGRQKSLFKTTDDKVTLLVEFKPNFIGNTQSFIAEWTQPDGSIYLSQPVSTKWGSNEQLITYLSIDGNAPSRMPGKWKVRLLHEGRELVAFPFIIEE